MTKYIILGHENPDVDSIISGYLLEKLLTKQLKKAEFIIPDSNISEDNIELCKIVGIDATKFQKPLPQDESTYILVDHHERDINGSIKAIIDHHPTNKNIDIPNYYNLPASSTAIIIAKNNIKYFSKNDILATIFATMVDTVGFHSAKATTEDMSWCQELCKKYNFDYQELLTLSLCPTNITNIEKASINGLKKHNIANHKIASSFIQLFNPRQEQDKIDKMIKLLKDYRHINNYTMFAFLVHDLTNFTSTLYKIYKDRVDVETYNEYAARGTIVIPKLTEELTKLK